MNDSNPTVETGQDREVEAKFRLGPEAKLSALSAARDLPDGYSAGEQEIRLIDDVYVDSADHALLRAGFALRLRCSKGSTKLTLKGIERAGLEAIHDRFELESRIIPGLAPLDREGWSPVIRRWVDAIAGEETKLLPVVNIGHARLLRPILGPVASADGDPDRRGPVAEWVVEELRVSRPDRDGLRAGIPEPIADFVEAELELLPAGSREQLEELSAHWLAQEGVTAQSESKLEQALRMMAEHRPERPDETGIRPETSMVEAGRRMLHRQLYEMLLCEGGARRGEDIEYVHDMRVACRRATGALSVFGEWFEPEALAPVQKLFKTTRRVLGPIRDRDVALEKLAKHQATLSPGAAQELEAVADRWRAEREAAYARLLEWLDGKRYRKLIRQVEALASRPGMGAAEHARGPGKPWQLRHVMPSAIQLRYAIIRSYEPYFEDWDAVPDELLHQLRIDCKRLRYCLEPVEGLMGEAGVKTIARLKEVQTVLGDFNDAVVKRDMLQQMIDEGLDLPAVRAYAKEQERILRAARRDLPDRWPTVRGLEMRKALGKAVAAL